MAEILDAEVVIGGGGIAGAVAAVALGQLGFRVLLIEPGQHRRQGGEVLHPRGVALLSQLGLLTGLHDAGSTEIRGFQVRDREGGNAYLCYATAGLESGIALEHERIHSVLFSAARRCPSVAIIDRKRVTGVIQRGDVIETRLSGPGGEATVRSSLLVGADGSLSRIRDLVGISAQWRQVSRLSAISIPADALPDPGVGHVFAGGGGASLAYPIGGGRARLMVDHRDAAPQTIEGFTALLAMGCPDNFRQKVADLRDDQCVRQFPTKVVAVGTPFRGRVVLIGDAAGTCHPLTASGMTSGIADALSLATALEETPDDIARALDRYATQCAARRSGRIALASALYEILGGAAPEFALLRVALIRYWSSVNGRRRATALLSMVEDRPAELSRAMATTLGYALLELLRRSTPSRLADCWQIGLGVSRVILGYRGSLASSSDDQRDLGERSRAV
jgi:squalene monooxygenase